MKTELEKAHEIIQAENNRIIELANNELNEFLEVWRKKHSVDILIVGNFSGGQINTSVEIIRTV